jgi:F-type H+-transporting ATPase subunit b
LTASEIESLTSALETQPGTVAVRTAFEISPELRKSTEASIKEIVGSHVNVTFESAPDLINGIELSVNGQKVAWSVADYLSSFEVSSTEEIR